MKILHVIGSMNPTSGGPCQGIRNLNGISRVENIYREVVCLDDPNSLFLGSDIFAINALGPGKTAWKYNPKLIPWFLQNLPRFDVVVVNGIWLYQEYAVLKAISILKEKKIEFKNDFNNMPKVFLMPHGMLDPYFQKAPGRKLKAIRNWFYWKLVESKNIQRANGLLFTCEEELQLARKTFTFYKPKKEINVGYGVEEPPPLKQNKLIAFRENCPGLFESPYLLYLGRIHPKKGVDMLVTAYLELLMNGKDQNEVRLPKLVIAGPGLETSFGRKLQQLIPNTSKVQSSILFLGMLAGDTKWSALHGCEAFILPSHQENFGISVVEAMACGKPVLISNKINIWKEIIDNDGGMVRDDSIEGTKQLLKSWVELSSEEKLKMSTNARNTFEEHFAFYPAGIKFLKGITEN